MEIIIIILMVVATTYYAYYWYAKNLRIDALRKKRVSEKKPKPARTKSSPPAYRCEILHAGNNACPSAKAIESKPILMDQASTLPFKACDVETCHCGYLRYDDRRRSTRRRDISGAEYYTAYRKNKRSFSDRRKSGHQSTNNLAKMY